MKLFPHTGHVQPITVFDGADRDRDVGGSAFDGS